MVSAVTIDGLDQMKQREHFFNDVKYATISLNKDIRLINEKFHSEIFQLGIATIKQRLQEEYSEFVKPTYGFLRLHEFSFDSTQVNQFLQQTKELYEQCEKQLGTIVEICHKLDGFGLKKHWNYQMLVELTVLFDSISKDVVPTRYWFDPNKYDFMQELMNETQTKVEEYQTAYKHLTQTWSVKALEPDNVSALDYYMERREFGMKLFDLNFHKAKKMLKDLFVDEYRSFQDSEIEQLNTNVYCIKRNEYWLSKNQTRIRQFLGNAYQETETDFNLLRTQYAIINRIGNEFVEADTVKQLTTVMMENESYQTLMGLVAIVHQALGDIPYEQLLEQMPCDKSEVMGEDIIYVAQILQSFFTTLTHLQTDYQHFLEYRSVTLSGETFQLEDLRKNLYCLERIAQKREWLKKNQLKIKELFRNEEPTMEMDWNALKDKLFHTDVKDCFQVYEMVDKNSFLEANGGQLDTRSILRYVLSMESPIKEEILYKRITSILEYARMTPKLKQEITGYLEHELQDEFYLEDGFFYEVGDDALMLRISGSEEDKRDISLIAPRELKAGILKLVEIHYEMTLDEIGKGISGLLGYPRRSKKLNDTIEQAVRELSRNDKIRRYSGGFRIHTIEIN